MFLLENFQTEDNLKLSALRNNRATLFLCKLSYPQKPRDFPNSQSSVKLCEQAARKGHAAIKGRC